MNIGKARTWLASLWLIPLLSWPTLAHAQETKPADNAVDPVAIAALDRMGEALRKLEAFSLVSEATTEIVLDDGQKVKLQGHTTYRVQRPNRLYIELKSDRRLRELFYDGDTLTVYSPRLKYYASAEHVGKTLGELAITLRDDYGIELPLADLFFWGTDQAPRDAVTAAMYVGPALLGDTEADQYAFRQEGADWQVWIRTRPIFRKK